MFHKLSANIWVNACLSFLFILGIQLSTVNCVFFQQSKHKIKTEAALAPMKHDSHSHKIPNHTAQFKHSCTYCQISNNFVLFSPPFETTQQSSDLYLPAKQSSSLWNQTPLSFHPARAPPV